MPSNPSKKAFKPRNVLKPKPQKRMVKQDKNKENTIINAQIKQDPKLVKKAKSCIPKASTKPTQIKNPRKGEYQKYMAESKDRERTIPSRGSSRKNSISAVPQKPPKKELVSKTEAMFQRARMALGKSKKPKDVQEEVAKPPLQKRKSEAVLDILKKQENIRKNLTNRNSFHNEASRNAKKSSMHNDRQSFRHSQERFGKPRLTNKKSLNTLQSIETDEVDYKKIKPSKITRKEARARIGLSDIPDDRIEELVKVKKSKLRQDANKEQDRPSNHPVPTFQYQKPISRMNNEPRVASGTSNESGRNSVATVKESLKIKKAVPEAQKISIVRAQIPDCQYDADMASSINDFDEFAPMYQEDRSRANRVSTERLKSKYNSKGREVEKKPLANENHQDIKDEENKRAEIEARKELVKLQQKAKLRKLRDEAEKEKQIEIKKKQNLDSLNQVFKKRTENYKYKKAVEYKDPRDPKDISLLFDEECENAKNAAVGRLTTTSANQSHENFKIQHFTGQKLAIRGKTSKTSAATSVTHSIQSPIANKIPSSNRVKEVVLRQSDGFEISTSYPQSKITGRKSASKISKKNIKKVISIPSVKIDKQFAKEHKRDRHYEFMDVIPENQDVSDVDTVSRCAREYGARDDSKPRKSEGSTRKVVISKVSKPTKDSAKKPSKPIRPKTEKVKNKKSKKTKQKGLKIREGN